ncbi:MAG: hypothetical protein LBN38_06980 [Verrucomicrobiota bacterium]|jgi:hypothetical protein|nr:hypothetical protein [Verrucomicrobiota bacterium]
MVQRRKERALERRLKEIEREKARIREQMADVARWVEPVTAVAVMPRVRESAVPDARRVANHSIGNVLSGMGVVEIQAEDVPENASSLEFAPGPGGLETKRVVMPRLQRTDLLRPSVGGSHAPRLAEPEYDRFRNYFGTTGLKRVREARRERGSQRVRTLFMIGMVFTLGFILFKMVT